MTKNERREILAAQADRCWSCREPLAVEDGTAVLCTTVLVIVICGTCLEETERVPANMCAVVEKIESEPLN
jgi:hypothetical protein